MHEIYEKMGISGREDLRPGMDIPDKGYTSTSPDQHVWSGSSKWEIRVKKGTPGAWVQPISSHPSEKEFILGRDVDTFRIVEVKPDTIVVEALRSEDLAKPKPRKRK
jgi:ADP-ribosyltransferase exoenzyme